MVSKTSPAAVESRAPEEVSRTKEFQQDQQVEEQTISIIPILVSENQAQTQNTSQDNVSSSSSVVLSLISAAPICTQMKIKDEIKQKIN